MNDELELNEETSQSSDAADDKLKALAEESEQRLQQLKRAQADLINYKKEESKRMQDLISYGNQQILSDFLGVMDGLEMIVEHVPHEIKETQKNWLLGMQQVKKQFEEVLSKYGIEKIAVSGDFDPNLHEAIGVEELGASDQDKDQPKLVEVRAGYTLHGRVVRPARVKVNKLT